MSDQASLPTEKAQEPNEAAQHQLITETMSPIPDKQSRKRNYAVTFDESAASIEMSASQKSSYNNVLSQPGPELSHRQRLLWLQKRRGLGLWVRCDDCDKWRYVAHALDRHELPNKWYCRMNCDKSAADCSVPETPMTVRDEEDFIHGEYAAGSVVWARMAGWPWWPAMVDDCPDTEQYYWLDGFSDIPTHYNVVFFDKNDVTRAWVAPEHLKPYASNRTLMLTQLLTPTNKYRKRIEVAMSQADDADHLPPYKRLAKYSFITRYTGKIVTPKKMTKEQLIKITKRLKRTYNLSTYTDSSSDSDENTPSNSPAKRPVIGIPNARNKRYTKIRYEGNAMRLIKDAMNCTGGEKTALESTMNEFKAPALNDENNTMARKESINCNGIVMTVAESVEKVIEEPDSMSGQMGSTEREISELKRNGREDNSKINKPERETVLKDFTISIDSPLSDDFEF